MTDVLLGIVAFATLVMAAVQIGVIVYASRTARRVETILQRVERDLQPVMGRLRQVGDDAARASALAVTQLERADKVFLDATARLETALGVMQQAVIAPVREGLAALDALKSVLAALRGRGSSSSGLGREAENEDALFIG